MPISIRPSTKTITRFHRGGQVSNTNGCSAITPHPSECSPTAAILAATHDHHATPPPPRIHHSRHAMLKRAEQPQVHVHLRIVRMPANQAGNGGERRNHKSHAPGNQLPRQEIHGRHHQHGRQCRHRPHHARRERHNMAEHPVELIVQGRKAVIPQNLQELLVAAACPPVDGRLINPEGLHARCPQTAGMRQEQSAEQSTAT